MKRERFLEIDVLRTIAILLMVTYHIGFNLQYYHSWNIPIYEGRWLVMGRSAAILFLLLVGISFAISSRSRTWTEVWKRSLQRSGVILGCAMCISIVTFMTDPTMYIRFGILHCIGVSILLLPFFIKFREWNILVGTACILLKAPLWEITREDALFLPFGIRYSGFQTLDYFPLFPWIGVILLGLGMGHIAYVQHAKQPKQVNRVWNAMTLPGRHALLLYMIHQPILVYILGLLL